MGLAVPATMLAKPVCKHGDSIYQPGRRSSAWTKVVSSLTTEAVIVGAVPGNGANTTTFGRLVLTAHTPAGVCAVLAGRDRLLRGVSAPRWTGCAARPVRSMTRRRRRSR
ncbi:hypothetical protein ACIBEH_05685 [Nocardia salmonicida]|uniref:hypothetical protein n=1 Tax=Nocardia salmonicida TaxID=53431 RepID=UPI00378EE4C8